MSNLTFKIIESRGDEFEEALTLRKEVLYKARGIKSSDDYEDDSNILIAGFDGDNMIATSMLVPDKED